MTAVLNDRDELAVTIESLRCLDEVRFEWIVMDGGSNDGTLELLSSCRDVVTEWDSRPDTGVYDAWNRGLSQARGRWVLFLGAGDQVDASWLRQLVEEPDDVGFIYGDLELFDGRNVHLIRSKTWTAALNALGDGLPIPHVGTGHARWMFERDVFDASFRVHGDWEYFARTAVNGGRYVASRTQARMRLGGISNNASATRLRAQERREIWARHALEPSFARRVQLIAKRCLSATPALHSVVQRAWHKLRSVR